MKIHLTPNLTHWYLKNLERNRVGRKDPERKKYELGFKLFELTSRASTIATISKLAYPVLRKLCELTEGTSSLRILDGNELLCLVAVESPSSLTVRHAEGTRVPCNYGAIGKLLTAYTEEKKAENLVLEGHVRKLTKQSVVGLQSLRKEWARIRMRGWAYSSGEAIPGVRAIAAPVHDAAGKVFAGVALAFPAVALPSSRIRKVAVQVVKAAGEISEQLGWKNAKIQKKKAVAS